MLCRIPWGGSQASDYMLKLMQLKYPTFPGRLLPHQAAVRPSLILTPRTPTLSEIRDQRQPYFNQKSILIHSMRRDCIEIIVIMRWIIKRRFELSQIQK